MKDLQELFRLMTSFDYKDRFLAEYIQLNERVNALEAMLKKYKEGTLDFTPSCSYELLYTQLIGMRLYLDALNARAVIEDIRIEDTQDGECK